MGWFDLLIVLRQSIDACLPLPIAMCDGRHVLSKQRFDILTPTLKPELALNGLNLLQRCCFEF